MSAGSWAAGVVVTEAGVLEPGTVSVDAAGRIQDVVSGIAPGAVDLGPGVTLAPGAVDLHGDAVEKLVEPRPGVRMPFAVAVRALDRRLAAAGVTTSFSALSFAGDELGLRDPAASAALARELRLLDDPVVDHRMHLRVEVTDAPSVAAAQAAMLAGEVDMVSVMNHTPGQGQFGDFEAYARYHERTYGTSVEESRRRAAAKQEMHAALAEHLDRIAAASRAAEVPFAWHDPDTAESVDRASELGATIAEFPTTPQALQTAARRGLTVVMGAPNLLRRTSSSGNLSAVEALATGVLDVLVSDYYPEAMWPAALQCGLPLVEAVELVAGRPAGAAGLTDRGRIAPGLRADLVGLGADGSVLCTIVAGRRVL